MTNTTINTASVTAPNKTFYDRQLLESATSRFVHTKFGQKRPIPKHNGKRVEFRRWNLFDPSIEGNKLSEGVTPEGQSLAQTTLEATIEQYGAYVEVTDLLDMTAYDSVIADSAELLGEQLGTCIEWVTRDALSSGSNVQYAGGKLNRLSLTGEDKLTVDEVRRAVRSLKRAKARPFSEDGRKPHFVCICSPEATYDLQSDTLWQDVSKYSNAEAIYSGEIGRLFGVVFVESTEAKVFSQSVLNTVKASTTSSTSFALKNVPTEAEKRYLSKGGNKIKIGTTEYTLAATGSFNENTNTVKLTTAATLTADAVVYSEDAGAIDPSTHKGLDIHSTIVFGRDAYGIIDLEGEGTMQTIIKPHGSAGATDPLNQRATVAAKVAGFTVKLLNELWLVRIEHAVSE